MNKYLVKYREYNYYSNYDQYINSEHYREDAKDWELEVSAESKAEAIRIVKDNYLHIKKLNKIKDEDHEFVLLSIYRKLSGGVYP